MFGGAYCKENIYSFKSSCLTLQALTVITIKFIFVISVLSQPPKVMRMEIFTMASFYYNYQNPSLFSYASKSCYSLLSTGITKFGSCSKMTPSCLENSLLRI